MPKVATKQSSNGAVKSVLKKMAAVKEPVAKGPIWAGPCSDAANGGVTQSMLGKFLVCRERFRINYVEGLVEEPRFSHRIIYGQMWHKCEEAMLVGKDYNEYLLNYTKELVSLYKGNQGDILHWYTICSKQFPIYLNYWSNHWLSKSKPLYQEEVFRISYVLPSGREVYLRGRWDGVVSIGKGVVLVENKTKGDFNLEKLLKQLRCDLQSMFYMVTLEKHLKNQRLRGVLYNVVRRPLSGGKFTISQRKGAGKERKGAETKEQFYTRLEQVIADNKDFFFSRFEVEISELDISEFKTKCLNPILEQLCDWWEHVSNNQLYSGSCHFQFPYGIYNPLLEDASTGMDEYLFNKSTKGLVYSTELFKELQ